MPQLSQIGEIYASQLFWLTIVFALIYFGIGRMMVPRIERTVDDRHARITGDLAVAEAARAGAIAAETAYRNDVDAARAKALAAVNTAKARGTESAEAQIKAGDHRHTAAIADAEERIATAKASALAEIQGFTVDAVEAIVAKVSGAAVVRSVVADKVARELGNG